MILALLVALASATPETAIPFESPLVPPSGHYEGNFDSAPVIHWSNELPGKRVNSATHTERSRPVVVGENILIGAAGGDGLYLVSRRDGTVVRKFQASGSVESEAILHGDKVYFADTSGTTWCYTLAGELVWKHYSGAPILVRPTVVDGTLYVTNVNDLAMALNADNGTLEWRYQRKNDLTRQTELALFAAPPAAPAGDVVVLGFSDGAVVALQKETGDVAWERRVGEGRYPDIVAGVLAYKNDLFASGYFKPLVAIDLASQNVRWRMEIGAANAPIIDQETGMLFHPGTDGRLRAIHTLTGAEAWTWSSKTTGALTTPVLTEAGVLVGSSDGGLYLIDGETGKETWRYSGERILEGVTAAPVVSGRQLMFVTNAGRLYSMLVPNLGPNIDEVRDFFVLKPNKKKKQPKGKSL